jgi:hypothetical protein
MSSRGAAAARGGGGGAAPRLRAAEDALVG